MKPKDGLSFLNSFICILLWNNGFFIIIMAFQPTYRIGLTIMSIMANYYKLQSAIFWELLTARHFAFDNTLSNLLMNMLLSQFLVEESPTTAVNDFF